MIENILFFTIRIEGFLVDEYNMEYRLDKKIYIFFYT